MKTREKKHLVALKLLRVRSIALYVLQHKVTGRLTDMLQSCHVISRYRSFKLLPHAAIWGHNKQRCLVQLQTLPEECWISGRPIGHLKCCYLLVCCSVFLAVNCSLMFCALIILFALSKCILSVRSSVFPSICLLTHVHLKSSNHYQELCFLKASDL